ncbi:MAG: sulfite exporter TauE/SafE family protein [Clostridia bacterium]
MINVLVGTLMGIISGFGIGGGSIFIIYLTMLLGIEQLTAQGINLVYFLFCATPAVILHIKHRLVNTKAMLFCSVSGIATSIFSSNLANSINIDILKRIFGVFLIYIGIKLVFTKKND